MPNTSSSAALTPDEFRMVVDRVVRGAPKGLSQVQLEALVHRAALDDEHAKAASVAPAGATTSLTPTGVVSGFLSGLGGIAKGVGGAIAHPIDTATGMYDASVNEAAKAINAGREGRYSEALGHGVAAGIPGFGPASANAGENIVRTGDIGHGIGEGAALAATLPSIGGPALKVAGRAGRVVGETLATPARYAGAAEMFRGSPLTGGAILAAPPLARAIGRGVEAAGGAYEGLADIPGRAVKSLRSLMDSEPVSRSTGPSVERVYRLGRAAGNGASAAPASVLEGEVLPSSALPAGPSSAGAIEAPATLRSPGGRFTGRGLPPSSLEGAESFESAGTDLPAEFQMRGGPASLSALEEAAPSRSGLSDRLGDASNEGNIQAPLESRPIGPATGSLFQQLVDLGYTPAEIAERVAQSRGGGPPSLASLASAAARRE